ncbi:acyl dehydratase [Panacagrimonas perspica]|uniref:Acyl dehydratase n=1 Tax=Panacagrimonas perspica TaxID=381431 RepID=A0A4R7PCA2_9GAMM|nr:MaoC family dehydratase [Panacagrimonas perspica]TDU31151.1 acyl dehydratase [Panacagrimonas perspica]THD01719.1 dehydratase [Panacagrimonas perspica]
MTKTVFDSTDSVLSRVGQELGVSQWLTIDQARVNLFADATDDHQWIHVDPKRAKDGPFGATIAHGYLTLSLVSRFMPELLELRMRMGVNYGTDKVRFPAPVKVGDRIRAHALLVSADVTRDGGIQANIRVTVEIENGDKPGCVADTIARYYF